MNCSNDSCVAKPEWKWNTADSQDLYAHVMDQNGPSGSDGTPYQYSTNVSDWSQPSSYWGNPSAIPRCTLVPNIVSGKLSFSIQSPSTDKACVAHAHNAGNWYNFPAATAGSDNRNTSTATNMSNSICPKGWQLPPDDGDKFYYKLIHDAYNITVDNSDADILLAPLSFVRLGGYSYAYGSLSGRGYVGGYWSSTAYNSTLSHNLYFYSGSLSPQSGAIRTYGYSVRCVSR